MIVVVGSGPAGVACASALVERGHRVTILDTGRTATAAGSDRFAPLRSRATVDWNSELIEELRASFGFSRGELPSKPSLGSRHAYAPDHESAPADQRDVALLPSLARGGLSNVWGASVLPYLDDDLAAWPLGNAALAPHYEAVLRWLPLAARNDGLADLFPLYGDDFADVRPTRQIAALLADLAASAGELSAAGATAGRARLAVRARGSDGPRRCSHLGLCLHGCPRGSIWSAGDRLAELEASGSVDYRPGIHVDRLTERGGRVEVKWRRAAERGSSTAERVFVAAGVLPTIRLMLGSLGAEGREVRLADSQYFTFPLLRYESQPVSVELSGNTLAQAFVEISDPRVRARRVHLQVYGYNDLMRREIAALLRVRERWAERGAQQLLGRFLYVQAYLHSDESRGITAALSGDGRLETHGAVTPDVRPRVDAVLRKVHALRRALRAVPLRPLLEVWPPGRGFHTGGGFPMSAAPGDLESDRLGRVGGFERIHVVDATVFPSVPATTISLTAMANAARIATEALG